MLFIILGEIMLIQKTAHNFYGKAVKVMGFIKNIFMVPIVMACATIGTIGMVLGIGEFFCDQSSGAK